MFRERCKSFMGTASTRDLTKGKIFGTLLHLSIPIAGGQVMQMAYNLMDMFWLGRYSSQAVAAAGAAGLFMWLSVGLLMVGRIGAEVGVAQARGRGDLGEAYDYARTAIFIALGLGTLYGVFLFSFRGLLVGIIDFEEAHVAIDTMTYMATIAFGMPAMYVSAAVTGVFVSSGNARTPFLINAGGLILNMILTPIFIWTLGLGVMGAAASSSVAKIAVMCVNLAAIRWHRERPFAEFRFFARLHHFDKFKQRYIDILHNIRAGTANKIFRLTWPVSLENTIWPLFTIAVTRVEVGFGASALSMSRVGTQVESLSWLVGAGFGAALTAFVGQNFGAGFFDRIAKAVRYSTCFLIGWGLLVTSILWFGAEIIFAVFLPEYAVDPEKRQLFVLYMRILAASQVFANLEYVASNTFRGMGRTLPPSVVSITSNVIRVPLAFFLSRTPLGVLGVWIAVSGTSGLRGIGSCIWYFIEAKRGAFIRR